jgi:serine/threonine protein kinase
MTESFCGSVAYLAPEILSRQGHSRTVDWYLLGAIIYELIVGLPPYYNSKK